MSSGLWNFIDANCGIAESYAPHSLLVVVATAPVVASTTARTHRPKHKLPPAKFSLHSTTECCVAARALAYPVTSIA
jgi:hypothetical protein